jgi:hypothetical protein
LTAAPLPTADLAQVAAHALSLLSVPSGGLAWAAINDGERATPTGPLWRALRTARPDIAWTVVVATGTHRASPSARAAHAVTHGLHDAAHILWHDASADTIPPPDLPLLAVGSVEPHWFAGWTGVHKTLTVGLWRRDRIERNHAGAMSPLADVCCLDRNPVFEGFRDAVRAWLPTRAAPLAAINFVCDGATPLAAFLAPCPLQALADALPTARAQFVTPLQRPLDRLLARVSPPLDASLYQAMKAIKNNAAALRDGGALILSAACPDGVGIDHFMRLLEAHSTWADADAAVRAQGYRLGDHKAVRLRHLTDVRRLQLAVVSPGLPLPAALTCHMRAFPTEADALAWAATAAPGPLAFTLDDAANRVLTCASTPQPSLNPTNPTNTTTTEP